MSYRPNDVTTLHGEFDIDYDKPRDREHSYRSTAERIEWLESVLSHKKLMNTRIEAAINRKRMHMKRWRDKNRHYEEIMARLNGVIQGHIDKIEHGVSHALFWQMEEWFETAYNKIAHLKHQQAGNNGKLRDCESRIRDMLDSVESNNHAIEDISKKLEQLHKRLSLESEETV